MVSGHQQPWKGFIYYCVTSNQLYVTYIEDGNKLHNAYNIYWNRKGIDHPG
jgi:hypothetical protein